MKNTTDFYRRNRPHIIPPNTSIFVTFSLLGAIPKHVLAAIVEEKERMAANIGRDRAEERAFLKYDKYLDTNKAGPHFMKDQRIVDAVSKQLHRFDEIHYDLLTYCIMSNHVHALILPFYCEPLESSTLCTSNTKLKPYCDIMHSIKGASGYYANKILGRTGQFWEHESYDRYIRDEKHFNSVVAYTLTNPVKAKLCKEWNEFVGSYLKNHKP